jgi:glycosyltransferase involved in cell wall biosynthesis
VLTLHDLKLACPAYKMLTHDGVCERCNTGTLLNVIKHSCIKDSRTLSTIIYLEATVNRALRSYVNNVSKFVVPSKFYLEKFVEWGFNREQFIYIPNFIDVEKYQPDFNAGKYFLYFGRLGHEKGLLTLLKAAASAKVPLVIAGSGPEEENLQRMAQEMDLEVKFLGYQSGEKLHSAICSARAVVLPSEWYENAPISILEAYALGVPVIGADIGGIPELIQEGKTGISFNSGSIDSLSQALRRIADLPDPEIEEMGRNACNWIKSEFTADLFRDRLLELYASLGASVG